MADQATNVTIDFPQKSTEIITPVSCSSDGPVHDSESGQTEHFPEVLIELSRVTLDREVPRFLLDSSTPYRNEKDINRIIKPLSCWLCRRLLACLSKTLAGKDAAFFLGSSSSNCPLKHELMIAVRIFLKQNGLRPDFIRVESKVRGPLRLILSKKRTDADKTIETQLDQHEIQRANLPTWMSRSYDVYQDNRTTETRSRGSLIPEAISVPKSSRSNECLMLARKWLSECLQQHPKCRNRRISELPRRVIDVTMGNLRLFVPKKGTRGNWVALSHCWGKTNTFKTTLNTLESHERSMQLEDLPWTFKDAVLVTRALGVQYLWIDSLCIVQDDGGVDFHAEAAKMCDIYRNSILTIAASCSASDCAGFLRERTIENVRLRKPQRLKSICFRRTVDHSRMLRNDPIHTRAWTFQETILPRRLLSFGSCEASWECETLRQCECGQIERGEESRTNSNELGRAAYRKYTSAVIEGKFHLGKLCGLPTLGARPSIRQIYTRHVLAEAPEPQDQNAYREYIEKVRRMEMHDAINAAEFASTDPQALVFSESQYIESGQINPKDIPACAELLEDTFLNTLAVDAFYRYWRRVLVPEYTRRALSKDSDRLIALQAIANDIHSGIHDRYLAGIWEGDLINQLCWQSVDGQCLPADNESPSWSWSSIRGPVVPFLREELERVLNSTEKGMANRILTSQEINDEEITNEDLTDQEMTDEDSVSQDTTNDDSINNDSTDIDSTDDDSTDDDSIDEGIIHDGLSEKTDRKVHDLSPMCIYNAECSLASENPCGRILKGSISLMAHAIKVQVRYYKSARKRPFQFHAQIPKVRDTRPPRYVPLNIEFRPDTPLVRQPDGSLTRCAQSDIGFPNIGLANRVLTAIVLFVDGCGIQDFCVFVCSVVSVSAEYITCRRLGIGAFKRDDIKSCYPDIFRKRFVLI